MKRIIALLLTVIICLCMAACGKAPEPEQSPQEPHTEANDTEGTEEKPQSGSSSPSGTAVEADGMLVYTDDLTDMKGTIRYDSDHAVFEVTESSSDLAEAGTTWAFPEKQEGL